MKKAIVCGAGGFIGSQLVKKLKTNGYWVKGIDLVLPSYGVSAADEFIIGDLRSDQFTSSALRGTYDELYQLAADMGGAGYIFTGENDADIMHNSATINLNVLEFQRQQNSVLGNTQTKIFYSGSACMYPAYNQEDPSNPNCREDSAYPAAPDSVYGWEKLFSERLYFAYHRNYGIPVAVARYHNIFGPEGTWEGGREKAPAAICRKVAIADDGGEIEVWGDGEQTRSFLYIDECLEAVERFMNSDFEGPVNIGSEEMISLNDLAKMVIAISGKKLSIYNKPVSYEGVRGRRSDNRLIQEKLGWAPSKPLSEGIEKTYRWIAAEVAKSVPA